MESAKKFPKEVLGEVSPLKTRAQGFPVRESGGLKASLTAKEVHPHDLDLGKLFVECFGWHHFQSCREAGEDSGVMAQNLMKESRRLEEAAGGAISSDTFLNITQQFAYTMVLDKYDIPSKVFLNKIPTRPSKFKQERVPGISHVGDLINDVAENTSYPEVGPSEDWIDTPMTRKKGMIARASKESSFSFDQTGVFLERLGYLWRVARGE